MSGQLRSDAVSLTAHSALTSTYIPHQVRYSNVCVVRDEEAAGSNPPTPTRHRDPLRHYSIAGLQTEPSAGHKDDQPRETRQLS